MYLEAAINQRKKQGTVVLESKFLNLHVLCHYFTLKGHNSSFELFSFTQGCFMPSMTDNGAGVLEKKMIDSNYRRTELQTDYGRSEKVT